MPWTDDEGNHHPFPSDLVTENGLRHIQACPACRCNFASILPMLDAAAWWERGQP